MKKMARRAKNLAARLVEPFVVRVEGRDGHVDEAQFPDGAVAAARFN